MERVEHRAVGQRHVGAHGVEACVAHHRGVALDGAREVEPGRVLPAPPHGVPPDCSDLERRSADEQLPPDDPNRARRNARVFAAGVDRTWPCVAALRSGIHQRRREVCGVGGRQGRRAARAQHRQRDDDEAHHRLST
ncbi:MAG: hypothetical protein JNM69_04940 [Archangium sp.]|nr:hypothetical protein [Archangium sp.]